MLLSWFCVVGSLFDIILRVCCLCVAGCLSGQNERKLLNDLLKDYNKLERPTNNESSAIVVKLGLTLQQIINVVSLFVYT